MENEVKAVREYSDLPVTTNFMKEYPRNDYNVKARD